MDERTSAPLGDGERPLLSLAGFSCEVDGPPVIDLSIVLGQAERAT